MKQTITQSYARNIEALKRVIVACKQQLMRSGPIGQFPHYWALIPVEQKNPFNQKGHMKQMNGHSKFEQ